jgi:hypothetical protein
MGLSLQCGGRDFGQQRNRAGPAEEAGQQGRQVILVINSSVKLFTLAREKSSCFINKKFTSSLKIFALLLMMREITLVVKF